MRRFTVEIAGRRHWVTHERYFRESYSTLELIARPGCDTIRVSFDLLEDFVKNHRVGYGRLQVSWPTLKRPTLIPVSVFKTWPLAASWYRTEWAGDDGTPTWVGLERSSSFGREQDYFVLSRPCCDAERSVSDGKWAPEVLGFPLWRSLESPHVWPEYRLYAGAGSELILYTMGGLAHGRFKLAKRQLDDFLKLASKTPLQLGFYNPEQGIDVALPIDWLKLPVPNNADRAQPHYVIDLGRATRWKDQLSLGF